MKYWVLFLCLFLLLCVFLPLGEGKYWEGIAYYDIKGQVQVEYGALKELQSRRKAEPTATFQFNDTVESTGWGQLWLSTEQAQSLPNDQQLHLAGYLEGKATAERVWQTYVLHAHNAWSFDPSGPVPPKLYKYVHDNLQFTFDMAKQHPGDDLWEAVKLVEAHLFGQLSGYNANGTVPPLDIVQLAMLHAAGDLEDLVPLLTSSPGARRFKGEEEFADMDCSMFVKVTPDGDLLLGHTTWRNFGLMLRMLKRYDFSLSPLPSKRGHIFFNSHFLLSSSPGFGLESKDDFYVIADADAQLLVGETTFSVLNKTLYSPLTPNVLLTWVRNVAANLLAKNGDQWTSLFARYVSFSYNNGFAVVDLKLNNLQPGTFWYIEQMPQITERGDLTSLLRDKTYAAFYNVPYFGYIHNISGYTDAERKNGSSYSYWGAPRAVMFAKLHSQILSVHDAQWLMRYNNYTKDPAAFGDPALGISSRYDLRNGTVAKPDTFGGVDSKVSSRKMLLAKQGLVAESGPTRYNGLPAFTWTDPKWQSMHHEGMPSTFNFDFIQFV